MKKQTRKPKKNAAKGTSPGQNDPTAPERRDVLKLARNSAIATAALGSTGWWVVSGVRAVAKEQDLSEIGTGTPTIVQIHDPSCPMCNELQRETRHALKCFDDSALDYKVANIRTTEGSNFSARLGLSHVTLVLMDGDGTVQQVLQGVRESDELKTLFEMQYPGTRLG